MTLFLALITALALAIAVGVTRRLAHYGASGMTAGMAAMMAAMGTGLSVGYAAGMAWDLGWATLLGVLAGGLHGLWTGRRYGPMAALDGAGGGVMGGLMGPMLAVMLLYLPLSLQLTALLMLALQAAFSAGAVYLVASAAGGTAVAEGWLRLVGRVLGAESAAAVDLSRDHYATLGLAADATPSDIAEAFLRVSRRSADRPEVVAAASEALAVLADPLRRAKYDAARLEDAACHVPAPAIPSRATPAPRSGGRRRGRGAAAHAPGRRANLGAPLVLAGVGVLAALILLGGLPLPLPTAGTAASATVPWPADAGASAGASGAAQAAAPTDLGGVQQVAITVRAGRYEPRLVEVQKGSPVRLTLQAIGDPG